MTTEPIRHVFLVTFLDHEVLVRADGRGRAKWRVVKMAQDAGIWQVGDRLHGLRCRKLSPGALSDRLANRPRWSGGYDCHTIHDVHAKGVRR